MDFLKDILGLGMEAKELSVLQVSLRAGLVFFAALIIVRVGHKRFMAKLSAFDVILGFMLASMLSRAVNGSAPFVPTLVGGLVLVLLHRFISMVTFHSDKLGGILKGHSAVLIRDGELDRAAMKAHRITEKDLLEEARLNGKTNNLGEVRLGILERSGEVSILSKS